MRVKEAIEKMNQKDQFLDSIIVVKKTLKEENQLDVKASLVQSTMRIDLKMRYKKVKTIAWTANSVQNLILR